MGPNGHNGHQEHIRQHAIRITEALYRTTELMPDGEPLKWSLRALGLEVLTVANYLSSRSYTSGVQYISDWQSKIGDLLTKLDLASLGTFVAQTNFSVLQREYQRLGELIGNALQSHTPIPFPSLAGGEESSFLSKGNNEPVSKENIPTTTIQKSKATRSQGPLSNGVRAQKIVEYLQKHQAASVGEIAKEFGETISEKTVQRELNALVIQGKLRKEGEKRWRRYFVL